MDVLGDSFLQSYGEGVGLLSCQLVLSHLQAVLLPPRPKLGGGVWLWNRTKLINSILNPYDLNSSDHSVIFEAEDIKKRWQEDTEELYKKDFYDPDNHDGMITHLEPDPGM